MSIDVGVFRPDAQSIQIVCTTAGAAATAIFTSTNSSGAYQGAPMNSSVRLSATGTSAALVKFGGSGVTVDGTTGMVIAKDVAGERFGFANYSHIATMAAAGTSTLTVTYGGGL